MSNPLLDELKSLADPAIGKVTLAQFTAKEGL